MEFKVKTTLLQGDVSTSFTIDKASLKLIASRLVFGKLLTLTTILGGSLPEAIVTMEVIASWTDVEFQLFSDIES